MRGRFHGLFLSHVDLPARRGDGNIKSCPAIDLLSL
jgi:hypothetical protein